MSRTVWVASLTFALGLGIGVIATQVLNAQQPIKRTEVLRTDLEGIEEKQAVVAVVEFAPGAVSGKHYHPAHEFAYIVEGSVTIETGGEAPATYGAGQVLHNLPTRPHVAKNGSMTEPARALQFMIADKGQPASIPVK